MSDNSRDQELEQWLETLREEGPTKMQIRRWQRLAVDTAQKQTRHLRLSTRSRRLRWLDWAVAASFGILIGGGFGLWFGHRHDHEGPVTQSLYLGATFERVFANME